MKDPHEISARRELWTLWRAWLVAYRELQAAQRAHDPQAERLAEQVLAHLTKALVDAAAPTARSR